MRENEGSRALRYCGLFTNLTKVFLVRAHKNVNVCLNPLLNP